MANNKDNDTNREYNKLNQDHLAELGGENTPGQDKKADPLDGPDHAPDEMSHTSDTAEKPEEFETKSSDLDREIGDIDDFLNASSDGTDDVFPLEDDMDTYESEKRKSPVGKFLALVIFMVVLGVGLFFGLKYSSNFLGTSDLEEFEQAMAQRSNDMVIQPATPETVDNADMGQSVMPSANPMNEPMPTAADESQTDLSSDDLEVMIMNTSDQEGEVAGSDADVTLSDVDVTIVSDSDGEAAANNIAEALERTQFASNEQANVPNAPQVNQDAGYYESGSQSMPQQPVPPVDNEVMFIAPEQDAIETPVAEAEQREVFIDAEQTEVAESEPEVIASVEVEPATETVAEQPLEVAEQTQSDLAETSEPQTDETAMPRSPDVTPTQQAEEVKPIELKPVQETPVKAQATTSAPKTASTARVAKPAVTEGPALNSAEQLTRPSNPLIQQGQAALAAGDFDQAGMIFSRVLVNDPSNVHALTGKQMAMSRVRGILPGVVGQAQSTQSTAYVAPAQNYKSVPIGRTLSTAQPSMPQQQAAQQNTPQQLMNQSVEPSSVTSVPEANAKIVAPANTVEALLLQVKTNPRDAVAAAQLGEAYAKQGDNANAITWYRKALQLDAIYKTNIDRMAIYDRLGTLQ